MKKQITIYPTGTCFDDAIDYINAISLKEPWNIKLFNKQYRIAHGICLFEDWRPYAHCWLEKANSCYDYRLFESPEGEKVQIKYTRGEFYTLFKPQKVVRYTIRDCLHLEKRVHGYCGPWDPQIRALCPDLQKN